MTDLSLLLKVSSLALSVAKYTGVVQDRLKLKVDALAGSELGAAVRALQQAANSACEPKSLLREARAGFNKAISLEEGFRLAAAHLGLALCHVCLGDAANAEMALEGLLTIRLPRNETLYKTGKAVLSKPWMLPASFVGALLPLGEAAPVALFQARFYAVRCDKEVAELKAVQVEAEELIKLSLREGCERVFGLAGKT